MLQFMPCSPLRRFSPVHSFQPCGLWPARLFLSMGFSRQECWSRLPCPSPGDLPDPQIEPMTPVSPALQVNSLSTEPSGKPPQFMLSEKKKQDFSGRPMVRTPPLQCRGQELNGQGTKIPHALHCSQKTKMKKRNQYQNQVDPGFGLALRPQAKRK